MTDSITVSFQGNVQKREEFGTHTEVTEVSIKIDREFTDPVDFHRFACRTVYDKIEMLLPDQYYLDYDDTPGRVSLRANAKQVDRWAETVANETGEEKVEILTLWLQQIDSMRIRRALHIHLESEYNVPEVQVG